MATLEVIRSCNSTLVHSQPLVAVFVGGTSGIGACTIRALASTHADHGKGLRTYIVGRKENAAQRIISECQSVCPGGQFRFVQATDLALVQDVDRVCAEIIRIEKSEKIDAGPARIDLLVMSQGVVSLGPRKDTREGLDMSMSLLYYSRMRCIMKLLPLLLASPLPAHVISIYAAGMEANLFPEDLSLRDPKHYSFANCRSHVVYMKTLFMEYLGEQYPGQLSLSHIFPGLVITDEFDVTPLPAWFRAIWWVVSPILRRFYSIPPAESGERMLFLASSRFPPGPVVDKKLTSANEGSKQRTIGSDGNPGSGAYALNWNGEAILSKKREKIYEKVRRGDLAERVCAHTLEAFQQIENGTIFTS